ncbi:MAG: tetratricopeptide repeat protein [Myxococcales bacterium]|nr:tetratricopeptide repeat protein [Myxococcales bacterium]MDH3482942.1 tetratricopeptide repeat protein [Myxococcales bacterium]
MQRAQAVSLILLWAVTVAVLGIALRGEFVWDDFALIVNNTTLRDPGLLGELLTTGFWNISSSKAELSTTYAVVYRPVTTLALFVQHQLFGLDARGFHLVSLLLHLVIVTLVFSLLRERLGESRGGWLGALAGAAFFAIHPSRAESVAWISASTELWMALFVFGGYAVWVMRPGSVVLPSVLFALALFAKETAIVIPAVLWIDMYGRRGVVDWKRWSVSSGLFAAFVLARFAVIPPPEAAIGWAGLLRRVLATVGHYIEATIWPWRPFVERGFRYTNCSGSMVVPAMTIVIAGLAAIGIAVLVVRFRALRRKPWLADLAWFFLFLAPVLNIIDFHGYGLAADRFLYVPIFGVAALFGRAVARASNEAPKSPAVLGIAVCTILIACGISTRQHVSHFRHSQALWEYEIGRNPSNLHALELVGTANISKDPARAIRLFQRGYASATQNCNSALAARFALLSTKQLVGTTADTDQSQLLALRTFYDLAVAKHRLELLGPQISLNMEVPESFAPQLLGDGSLFAIPHAAVTMRTLDLSKAEALVQRILEMDPDNDTAWVLLARIHARLGRYVDARASLDHARRRAPENPAVDALERALHQAMQVATQPVENERQERLRSAQIAVLLGAPEAARRALQPELDQSPADPIIVLAYVRTMVADGRIDLAEDVIQNAERVAPENAAKWRHLRDALPPH